MAPIISNVCDTIDRAPEGGLLDGWLYGSS